MISSIFGGKGQGPASAQLNGLLASREAAAMRLFSRARPGRRSASVTYATQISWVLIAAFALSALYELYRSTARAGTSKYDSMRVS
jgi:hypothetical protein